MVNVTTSYPDFSAGEISPKLYGRFDLAAYYNGGRKVENFITQVTGPAFFRTGTVFASVTKGNNPAFLHIFAITDALSFVLEFTNNTIRFYRNNGIVESSPGVAYEVTTPYLTSQLKELKFAQNGVDLYITHPSHPPKKLTYISATNWTFANHAAIVKDKSNFQIMSAITNANPAVVTYTGADTFANGDTVYIAGAGGMTQLNDKEFTIANLNTGANTFELVGIDSTGYGTYIASTGTVQKVTSNSASFIAVGEYPSAVTFYEQRLIYGGSTNKPQTLYFSRSGETSDFTIGTEVDDGIIYTVAGDGNTIKWLRGTSKFLAIGTFGDVLQATGGIDGVITTTSISIKPTNSFGVADINPIGKGSQVFFVQRNKLILRSFEFDFQQDSYVPVDRNTIADHITVSGITQIAYQEGRPNIVWATKNNGTLIGMTIEDAESVSGWHRHSTDGEVTSIISTPRTNNYNQLWLCVKRTIEGVETYFIEYLNDPVIFPRREDYIENSKAQDDSIYANLMFEAQKDYIHVDCSLSYYGNMSAFTIAPSVTTGSGTFTASGSTFSINDIGREIWRKSVTGMETGRGVITGYTSATVVNMTVLETFNSTSAIPAGEWYFTSDNLTGLDHLEGKIVTVVADGGQHTQQVVTDGEIPLDRQASVVHVGLGYKAYLETTDIEGGGTNGPVQTKRKTIGEIGVRFLDTLYAKTGTGYYNLTQIEMRTASMRMDRPPLPYTGDDNVKNLNAPVSDREAGWARSQRVIICQDQPFPCNIQLVIPYASVSN